MTVLEFSPWQRRSRLSRAAYLFGQIGSHNVYVVREILTCRPPGPRLAAQLAVGADLAGHAGYFSRERVGWSTMVLIVFLSSRISPFRRPLILRDRSPRATAVVIRRCYAPDR